MLTENRHNELVLQTALGDSVEVGTTVTCNSVVKPTSKKLTKSAKKRVALEEAELFAAEIARAESEQLVLPPCAAPVSRPARRAVLMDATKLEARSETRAKRARTAVANSLLEV